MQTTNGDFKKDFNDTLKHLEALAGEVRVRMHLASLEARDVWANELEPRLVEARVHAKEATHASKAAIESTLEAFREFAKRM